MGKLWRLVLVTYACIAVQLLWTCGSAKVPAGFMSLDCGSPPNTSYTDSNTIEWTSDADLMTEGEPRTVGGEDALSTMRLFTGNQSKYCYRLTNSAVKPGAFFLVRAWFWMGLSPAYTPKSSDGLFRFKLLIDADEWWDVRLANDSTNGIFHEIYTRALHDSITVCLARSAPGGDTPFISALELRPLPSSLHATRLISSTNRNFIDINHDYISTGAVDFTRYPSDSLDRYWLRNPATPVLETTATINVTSDAQDIPPVNVLQTAFGGTSEYTEMSVNWTYSNRDVNGMYYCLMYFAEIDPRVNATGQRVFNILVNGEAAVNSSIDVFAEVGAYTSYEIMTGPTSASEGTISFSLIATNTSQFPPFRAATELFQVSSKAFSNGSSSIDVTTIDELKASMNLDSYTGDPCLPIGFGYSWLTCMADNTETGVQRITAM